MVRLATGIEGFDGMVQGGLPVGSSVILQGPSGQEKLQFALTFLAEGLKGGASGVLIISSQSPDSALATLRTLGVDLDAVTKDGRLRVVDWWSWSEETVKDVEERGIVHRSSIDLTNLGVALSRAIAAVSKTEAPRAVIEMLSPATNVYEVTQVYAFAQSAKKKFDRFGFTSLVLLEKEMHAGPEITTLHQPFDGVIEIERTRIGDRIVRKIGVLSLKDTAADPTFRILEMTESGLRVVRATKPSESSPAVGSAPGSVLESQEERARRLTLIMQIAGERLKLDPRDADALFAMAAAQATLDDPRGGLESLDRLAELDPSYPGLWVLKTKLHARLGEAERARQSRARADQAEQAETEAVESTVPCPMCDAPVAVNATLCPSCGVKFAPARKLEDELEDLGNAAVQDMVSEGLAGEASPPIPPKPEGKARPPTAPEGPAAPKPLSKKGLTNGLVLSRGAGRRTGMTNGLKGRTNGLRGRTNGLTNGLGRTNGLTNGLGRTNGLTNGLGRTNGLTNGLGRTNGLTNGLGRTNGLTNGLGGRRLSGFRAIGFRSMMETAGWKLYVIPLIVVGLLLVPLFTVPEYSGRSSPIQIDGQFGDWAGVATEAMTSGGVPDPNIDVVRFGVMPNLGPVAFYVELAGSALAGGGPAPGTMDSVRIFVDIDGSASTGYRIDGLGADRMIEVSGHNGTVLSSTLSEFDSNRDSKDWNGWIKATATPAAASGSRIEAEAEWIAGSSTSAPIVATVHTASWDGQADAGDFPVSPGLGTLSVTADPQVPNILAGNGVALLRLTLTAHVLPVTLGSLHVEVAGTAPASAATSVRLMDGANVLAQVVPTSRDVTFSFPPIQIAPGAPTTLLVAGDFVSSTGETYGIRLPSSHPFGLGAGVISLRENPGARSLGYLGFVPSGPRVDGAFDEWTALSSDGMGDVGPRNNPDIDLRAYGAQRAGGSTFLYTDVTGRIFHGTPTPELPKQAPPQAQGAADTDRDGVPDPLDPFPLDFNNDGIPDARTNGDYDGDGVTDYGFPGGTDYWLNTTIPATFPAPYAGRVVSVYIGPDNRPPALGEDVIRIFLDLDNSSFSGYSIGGIGADRLVELRGKDGTVTQSALLGFSGSFPGEWAWTPLTPVTVALGYHAVELSVPLNASNMYVESGDFWGSVDSTTVIRAFAPLTSSFKVSSASAPLAVPWQQAGPQTTATQIDPNSNAATTRYNQQRKVVRAGTGAGATPCDAANSAGCWYAIFYDQVFDNPPPTTDSFLPTANVGTTDNCGGPDAGDWVTPNNAHSDTDSSASATAAPNPKNKVFCTKWKAFGFSIPTDATISAVKVQFRYHQGGTDSGYNLNIGPRSLGGGAPFVCPVQVESTHSGTFATYLFDFTSACSGHSWVPADFNSNGIEVDIGADRGNTNTAQTLSLDWVKVQVTYAIIHTWDRVVLTRSRDTSGSTWSPTPVVLASGRASDTPLLYSYDSTDPSIAMDSLGYLHVVWVSAATTGDQTVLNLVRYTKTTVPYPTEAQLASSANWAAVTNVDDASPGYMPTISTDTSNNPHIAWSQSKAFENVATIDYRSNTGTNTVNSPKSRTWDGTSWSASETEEATAGSPLRNVRMAYSPIASNERIVVSVSDDGWLDAYVCTPTCTVTNNLGQVWSTAPVSPDYRFDIAYEQLSGTAILVYGVLSTDTTRDIAYREYTGSWGPEQYVDNTINATDLQYSVLHLAPRAGSDQIGLIGATTNNVVDAWIWSGTAFGSLTEMTPTGYNADYLRDHLAIAWETNSGNLMAVTIPSGGQSVLYKRFTTSWSSASTFTCSAAGKSIEFMSLKPNPASTANDMILAAEDVGSGFSSVNTCYWDGSGWSNLVTHDSATDSWISRAMDFAWEATGSKGLLVWGTTSGQITYRTFSAPNTWGSITNVAMGTSTHLWVTLQTNPNPQPGATRILGVVMEGTGINLGAITWDGGTFSVVGASTFSTNTGSTNYESYDVRYHPPTGGVYYKNKAGGTWRATVTWGATYTGVSVDVSPQNNYVSLASYFDNISEQAAIAYRSNTGSNTINSPKVRTWDGSAWSAETERSTAGSPIRTIRMAWSPTDANTRIIVTESDDGWLDAYVCTSTCTVTNNIGQVWSTAPTTAQARFDIAFEQVSGKAILAYHKEGGSGTQDIAYKTYANGAWSGEQYIDDPGSASTHYTYSVIKLASKRGSNQIGLIGGDLTNTRVNAWIWDGSAWGNFVAITTTAGPVTTDNADLAWESSSGRLLAVAATNGVNIVSKEFGTSWGSAVTFQCVTAGATMQYARLKANPLATADDAVVAVVDSTFALNTCYWTGSAWANRNTHDGGIDQYLYRDFDFAWEATGSKGLLVYSTTAGQITYRTFTAPNTWGTITNVAMGTSDHTWIQARTNPSATGGTKIMGAASDNSPQDLGAFRWDGTTFTVIGSGAFSTDTGGFMDNEMFDLKYPQVRAGGSGEIRHMACKDLSVSNCDASSEFTKWDGSAGVDTVAMGVVSGAYPSLAITWDANGDLWVAYEKDINGTSRGMYGRYLDYPSGGWLAPETIDSLAGTVFTGPSIGIDKDNNVHALYASTSGPQVYYKMRSAGVWGARTAVDTSSHYPSLMVRAPNDVTYGTSSGGLYWKTSTSETYFYYIPEFETAIIPILGVLGLALILGRRARRRRGSSVQLAPPSRSN